MKKLISLILVVLVLAAAACAQEHVHAPSGMIDMDMQHRWELCSCGEKMNVTAHEWTQDEWGDQVCALCGAAVYPWDDDSVELNGYDAYGNDAVQVIWDAEDNIIQHTSYLYTYDENGNVVAAQCYEGELLVSETWYTIDADGWQVETKAIAYAEDGSKCVTEYNEFGEEISTIEYDADGQETFRYAFERTYDENGNAKTTKEYQDGVLVYETEFAVVEDEESFTIYTAKTVSWEADGSCVVSIGNADGVVTAEQHYDEAGNLLAEFTFENFVDDEGNPSVDRTFMNGELVEEKHWKLGEDGWFYVWQIVTYEDGVATVEEYTEDEEIVFPSITLLGGEGTLAQDGETFTCSIVTIEPGQAFGEVLELDSLTVTPADGATFAGWMVYDVQFMENTEALVEEDGVLCYELFEGYYLVIREYTVCQELISTEELAQVVCDTTDHVVVANFQ